MLFAGTAAGRLPVEAVTMMDRIVVEAEAYDRKTAAVGRRPSIFRLHEEPAMPDEKAEGSEMGPDLEIAEVVCAAGVYAAERLPVRQIVAFSQGGFTARMVARNRPQAPILVFTTDRAVARRIQLVWGVRPFLMNTEAEHHDEVVEVVERQLLATGMAAPGETIVILMGDPIRERPLTNLVRVHRLRAG